MAAMESAEQEGRVVAGHGRLRVVEIRDGRRLSCLTAERTLQVLCGDRVSIAMTPEGGVIQRVAPRTSLFSKADAHGKTHPVAANIDRVFVTLAVRPEPDFFLTDKYLAALAAQGLEAALIFNKVDLLEPAAEERHDAVLDGYRDIGYPLFRVSAHSGAGLTELREMLRDRTSLLVGQSGVGKSSLLNRLIPDAAQRIHDLSAATDAGRHTTTATTLHTLPGGGALLDSPGVRDIALPPLKPRQLTDLFREFPPYAKACRFADCLHANEPGCAVKGGVDAGAIHRSRYESYLRLLKWMQEAERRVYT